MLQTTDVPSHAILTRLETVPGTADDHMPIDQYKRQVHMTLANGTRLLIVQAIMGSGKSHCLPGWIQSCMGGKWLCMTPNRIDIENMQANAPKNIKSCSPLPQVDHVLESGFSRILFDYHNIIKSIDYPSPQSSDEQRAGHAGRVKRGCVT